MIVEIPGLKLASEANEHRYWRARSTRAAKQRAVVDAVLRATLGLRPPPDLLPAVVVITRRAPRVLDSDNATSSAKHVRDAIAAWGGVDDGDPRWHWVVRQEVGRIGVRIEILPGVGACAACGGSGVDVARGAASVQRGGVRR